MVFGVRLSGFWGWLGWFLGWAWVVFGVGLGGFGVGSGGFGGGLEWISGEIDFKMCAAYLDSFGCESHIDDTRVVITKTCAFLHGDVWWRQRCHCDGT